jgi:hypothetical protein
MKVKELITLLSKEDGDREVILQGDSEGNDFSPLSGMWRGRYHADDSSSGYPEADEENSVSALFLTPIR